MQRSNAVEVFAEGLVIGSLLGLAVALFYLPLRKGKGPEGAQDNRKKQDLPQ